MRFHSDLKNIRTFASEFFYIITLKLSQLTSFPELTAAFSTLEKLVWLRLSDETAHFTVVPDTGSQIWS